jgi:hypothetical protein
MTNLFLHPEDGGCMDLRNVGILPQHYTASQTRRPRLETSPPRKSQVARFWRGSQNRTREPKVGAQYVQIPDRDPHIKYTFLHFSSSWAVVRVPAEAGNFSLHHHVQTSSGAHPASYPIGTRGSFPGSRAAGAWSWSLTSISCRGQECLELYFHSPIRLHGVVLS